MSNKIKAKKISYRKLFPNDLVGYLIENRISWTWELWTPNGETLIKRGRTLSFLSAIKKSERFYNQFCEDITALLTISKWERIG